MTLKMDKQFIDRLTKQFGVPQVVEIYRNHNISMKEKIQQKIDESNIISDDSIARLNHLNHLSDELVERKNKSKFQVVKEYFKDLYHKTKIKNDKML
jgi:hypothetical protein